MKYFRLLDDINFPNRWHLDSLVEIDGMELVEPPILPVDSPIRDIKPFHTVLQVHGKAMDYTTTSFRSVPIGSFKVIQALSGLNGFTAYSTFIDGFQQKTDYFALHFWDEADCVDEERSEFTKFTIDDPVRPDLAGKYSGFYKLIIDPKRAMGKHIFRLAGATSRVIVSEEVKRRFEQKKIKGAMFTCVTPDE